MNYDVQIGNTIRRGISYAELVVHPIEPDTFVRRDNGEWIRAKNCIELTHILCRCPSASAGYSMPVSQNDINDYSQDECVGEEIDDFVDGNDGLGEAVEKIPQPIPEVCHTTISSEEERIFIPTAEYFKCKQKRKAAIIGVCTLGLAGLSLMGVGNTWCSNIFAGTSFSANAGIGFVLKCLSFFLLTALIAIPHFIYSVFALIYYSIRIKNLKR